MTQPTNDANSSLPAPQDRTEPTPLRQLFHLTTERGFVQHVAREGVTASTHKGWSNQCPECVQAALRIYVEGEVAAPARAHQEEKEQDALSRVDGERLSEGQELPRKPRTGEPQR